LTTASSEANAMEAEPITMTAAKIPTNVFLFIVDLLSLKFYYGLLP
jgi:hypothetical protein